MSDASLTKEWLCSWLPNPQLLQTLSIRTLFYCHNFFEEYPCQLFRDLCSILPKATALRSLRIDHLFFFTNHLDLLLQVKSPPSPHQLDKDPFPRLALA